MAASFIPVDQSKPLGHNLMEAAVVARDFYNRIRALQSVMAGMANGTDMAIIEAQFGLPQGRGADVQYMINQLKASLDGIAQMSALPDWFGAL